MSALSEPVCFELRRLQNGLDRLLLGRLDEAAGVDDHDIGVGHIVHDLNAVLLKHGKHMFTVHQIFGASQ